MVVNISVCSSEEDSWDTLWKWSWFTREAWESEYWRENRKALRPFFSLFRTLGVESILDCSCGLGFKTVLLAKEGYDVEGSDASATAIKHAPQLAREQRLDIRFFRSRWEDLGRKSGRRYDCVFSDYFDETRTLKVMEASAKSIRSVLDDGGKFVFCSVPPRANLSKLIEREWERRKRSEILPPVVKAGKSVTKMELAERVSDGILEKDLFLIEEKGSIRVEITSIMNPRIKWRFEDYHSVLRRAGFREFEAIKKEGQTLGLAAR